MPPRSHVIQLADASRLATLAAYVVARERGAQASPLDHDFVRGILDALEPGRARMAGRHILAGTYAQAQTTAALRLAATIVEWARERNQP